MPILEGLVDHCKIRGILRALADALFRRARLSTKTPPPEHEGPAAGTDATVEPCPTKTTRHRLREGVACLERLDAERERHGDSRFGKTTEDRIVWGELIELELQEIDERVSRICGAAGRSLRPPLKSNLREGGPHERNDS